jgi:hypothetical protein
MDRRTGDKNQDRSRDGQESEYKTESICDNFIVEQG